MCNHYYLTFVIKLKHLMLEKIYLCYQSLVDLLSFFYNAKKLIQKFPCIFSSIKEHLGIRF